MAEKTAPAAATNTTNETGTERRVSDEDRRKAVQAPRSPRVSMKTLVSMPFGVMTLGAAIEWDSSR